MSSSSFKRRSLSIAVAFNKMLFVNGKVIEEQKKIQLFSRRITSFKGQSSIVEVLELHDNQLTSFSVEKGAFPNLERLSLACNQLTLFSAEKGTFPNLKTLYLGGNQLTSFSVEEGAFPNLEILGLAYNQQLTSFVAEEGAFPNLKVLQLFHNPRLEVLEISAPKLERLSIRDTGLRFIDESLIAKVADRQNVQAR